MLIREKIFLLILILLSGSLTNCTFTHDDILQKQLFDLNWKFSLGSDKTANEVGFNDINWKNIDLPHEWSTDTVLNNFLKSTGMESQTKVTGWYRKNFEIPENWVVKRIIIEFEGISVYNEVFVNGISVKCSENGKQNTKADLTPHLNQKGNNLIVIRVDVERESNLMWKADSGIYRHVWLVIKDNEETTEPLIFKKRL